MTSFPDQLRRHPVRPVSPYNCSMLEIKEDLSIPLSEIDVSAIRSRGPGGQNINKVSTAIHIRFDVLASSALSAEQKTRILGLRDTRLSKDGVIVIKSQRYRSRDQNRSDALEKLAVY